MYGKVVIDHIPFFLRPNKIRREKNNKNILKKPITSGANCWIWRASISSADDGCPGQSCRCKINIFQTPTSENFPILLALFCWNFTENVKKQQISVIHLFRFQTRAPYHFQFFRPLQLFYVGVHGQGYHWRCSKFSAADSFRRQKATENKQKRRIFRR